MSEVRKMQYINTFSCHVPFYSFCQRTVNINNFFLRFVYFQKGAYIELTDVKVQAISVPQFKRPILSFKMTGNNYSVKIYKGIEPKAVKLRRYEYISKEVGCSLVCSIGLCTELH
jgi:hypothetical protein